MQVLLDLCAGAALGAERRGGAAGAARGGAAAGARYAAGAHGGGEGGGPQLPATTAAGGRVSAVLPAEGRPAEARQEAPAGRGWVCVCRGGGGGL